jgi:hypothetical protein
VVLESLAIAFTYDMPALKARWLFRAACLRQRGNLLPTEAIAF